MGLADSSEHDARAWSAMSTAHSCFLYEDRAHSRVVTAAFLAEGLRHGQRVGYMGWDDPAELAELRASFIGIYEPDDADHRDAVLVASLDDVYRRDVVPAPDERLEFWARTMDETLAAGFDALRVVTDTTPWLSLPDQRGTFLRSEMLLDRYMLDHPLTVLCVCDRTRLDADAIDDILSIHPSTMATPPPFRVHAAPTANLALDGEIDAMSAPLLERLLADVDDTPVGQDLLIDAEQLAFVNHHGVFALERHAVRAGLRAVVMRRASSTIERLIDLLDLQHVRTEGTR